MYLRKKQQTGLGLAAAIFLIVVISLIALALTRTVSVSADTHTQALLAHHSLQAAESGANLAIYRVFPPQGASSCQTWTWQLSDYDLPGCSARAVCSTTVVNGETFFTIESDGTCTAGPLQTQRGVVVRLK